MNRSTRVGLIVAFLVLLAIALAGCQTLKGATGDLGWGFQTMSDNISTE